MDAQFYDTDARHRCFDARQRHFGLCAQPADFGLYRTTVGNDTGNDMLENITTYEEQERLAKEAAEKESIESSKAAEEASIAKEQQEIKAAHKETSKRKVSVAVIVIIVVITFCPEFQPIKNINIQDQ